MTDKDIPPCDYFTPEYRVRQVTNTGDYGNKTTEFQIVMTLGGWSGVVAVGRDEDEAWYAAVRKLTDSTPFEAE
ncbi:MAG TPA: hypothetical protein VG944_08430 [Fimbriimonas sp.]|nr:hypothetical protein [Fimbriimonas sp.]